MYLRVVHAALRHQELSRSPGLPTWGAEHRVRKPGGGHYTYYRLVESYREGDKVKQPVVAHLGALSQAEEEYLARRFAELAGG